MFSDNLLVIFFLSLMGVAKIHPMKQCGRLNERQLYNKRLFPEMDEHNWIGRIMYNDTNADSSFRCLGILIHPRYVLAPANCFKEKFTAYAVVFHEDICTSSKSNGVYPIENTLVHFGYNTNSLQHDLAVIKLAKSMEFSAYIQPLCLPVGEEIHDTRDYFGKQLKVVGYTNSNQLVKTQAYVLDYMCCSNYYNNISTNEMCTYPLDGAKLQHFMKGSALIGVHIVDGEPRHYFLIGFSTKHFLAKSYIRRPTLFLNIFSYVNWISNQIS